MLIYYLLLLLSFILAFNRGSRKRNTIAFIILWVIMVFIGFFRDVSVGSDNVVYSLNFEVATMNPATWSAATEFEPGFAYFLAVFKTYISDHYPLFMGTIFLIYMLGIYYLYSKYSCNKVLALCFMLLFLYYTPAFNIMRQYTALGLFCFVFPLIFEKKRVWMYIGLTLLITFFVHRSMIAMLLLPIIYYTKIRLLFESKKVVISLLLISYIFIFVSDAFIGKILGSVHFLDFLGERYVGYASNIQNSEEEISKVSSFFNVCFAIFLIWLIPQKKMTNIYMISYILGIIICNTLGAYSNTFMRVSTNLLFMRIMLYVDLWHDKEMNKITLFRLGLILYGLVFFANALYKNFGFIIYSNRLF